MEKGQMTHAEQNLLLLESAIPANEKFYVWCFRDDGRYIASSCPEKERALLEKGFRIFGGMEKAMAHLSSKEAVPQLIGSPIGMHWAVSFEYERENSLVFVMGPVFYHPPAEAQLREALRPYRDSLEDARWGSALIEALPNLPVIPHAIFARYVIMTHNMLTRQQLDVSALYTESENMKTTELASTQNRDRAKVYLAERAMLQMVRNGDINYHRMLTRSSSMSPGVGVQGREPLQQARISVIVFTSLVCRAAMEGGLSPEIAYALGDSYIQTAVNSNDAGELSALASTMYHDFIFRVHHLHVNPSYSPAIQKCCDYIELSLDKIQEGNRNTALSLYSLCQDRARKGAAGIYRSECQGAVGEAGLQHGQLLHPVLPRYYGLHTRAISEETQSAIICADLFQWREALYDRGHFHYQANGGDGQHGNRLRLLPLRRRVQHGSQRSGPLRRAGGGKTQHPVSQLHLQPGRDVRPGSGRAIQHPQPPDRLSGRAIGTAVKNCGKKDDEQMQGRRLSQACALGA